MLTINSVDVKYGKVQVIRNVSLKVDSAEFVSIIGSNGAGKSTILRSISGLLRPAEGEILFLGEKINNLSPNEIVEKGISQVPEGRKLFSTLSVLDSIGGTLMEILDVSEEDIDKRHATIE